MDLLQQRPGLHTPEEDRAFFRDVIFDRCEVWGRFEGAHLIGLIALREPHIEHLYVLPVHQEHGLGTFLLSLAQQRCREPEFWTFQRNDAARYFHERKGFIAIETMDGVRNDENEPDVRYRWQAK